MSRHTTVDEAALLRKYRMRTLDPARWEDVDYEAEGGLIGDMTSGMPQSASGTVGGDKTGTKDEPDPLGLKGSVDLRDMDLQARASILLSSKAFDPKAFLSTAHPDATYRDLAEGVHNLRDSIEQRSEALRILVEENFDRFVAVKASTDGVYSEMREDMLANDNEHGTRELKDSLKHASHRADQVFLPSLENSLKAQKLQSTLSVFEKSKFFSNLPGSILESIRANRYDVALRDYKKGKFLLETRPAQLLPVTVTTNSQKDQQRRIIDKVWSMVEKIVGEMRASLLALLRDPRRSVEEQEKTIEILLELDASDEAIWTCFDSQHQHILHQMRKSHDQHVSKVAAVRAKIPTDALEEKRLALDLQRSVFALSSKDSERLLETGEGHEVWHATLAVVKNLSDVVLQSLPSFWRIAKAFMDGKFSKSKTPGPASPPLNASRRSPTQCRQMALEIINLYISLLSSFFTLSDMAVTSSSSSGAIPPFVPPNSNSLTTGLFTNRILQELFDCVGEIGGNEISKEAGSGLKGLVDNTRWRFEEALCETWAKDAKLFYMLEDWVPDADTPSTTGYLARVAAFQRHNATSAYLAAGGIERNLASTRKPPDLPPKFVTKIKNSFFDALYFLLDGLVHLAFNEYEPLRPTVKGQITTLPEGVAAPPDVGDIDTRILLTISNLSSLKKSALPKIIKQLESLFSVSTDGDRKTLGEVVDRLDEILFNDFKRRKAEILHAIIRRGILESGVDWARIPKPQEVGSYVYEVLLALVQVHAQVSLIAKPLLERTLGTLLEEIAKVALESFKQVDQFGMGGMLSATLEIEFMHQTLMIHVTPPASAVLSEIYATISEKYARAGQDDLQNELDAVKKSLYDTRRATLVDFLCLRVPSGQANGSGPRKPTTGSSSSTSGSTRGTPRVGEGDSRGAAVGAPGEGTAGRVR